jgi:hypothetical protein
LPDLGGPSAGLNTTNAVNGNGDAIGTSQLPYGPPTYVPATDVAVWPHSGGVVDLNAATGAALISGVMNSKGLVAGTMTSPNVAGGVMGYTFNGQTLAPFQVMNATNITVTSLNDNGEAIGSYVPANGVGRPYYFVNGNAYDLNSLVQGLPAGMVLTTATQIVDSGQIVVTATPNGSPSQGLSWQNFILTPTAGTADQTGSSNPAGRRQPVRR